jgi:hypothetical protein
MIKKKCGFFLRSAETNASFDFGKVLVNGMSGHGQKL